MVVVNFLKNFLPGIILSIILATLSSIISQFIPYHLISASVFALLIGMLINPIINKYKFFDYGIKFASSKLLKTAIVIMGLSLSFSQVLQVGKYSLIVMTFTLIAAFLGGYLLGKALKMDWKLSSLISAGTGICGGSAIAAIAPVIKAPYNFIAYSISATFIFDVIMVIIFPIIGKAIGMSDIGFGLWSGTAINDTSSVVAAGYAFSEAAGQFSVIVKLTRTLSIIPVVIIFSIISHYTNKKSSIEKTKLNFKKIFPFFIVAFLLMVMIKSLDILPTYIADNSQDISKFLMVMALGAIGIKTNFKQVCKSGFKPMLHGFIISILVVILSLVVQFFIGQI